MNYEEFLKDKYGKLSLSSSEVAIEMGVSRRMVDDRVRKCSSEIPEFKKVGSITLFPLKKVAYFLENGFVEVM